MPLNDIEQLAMISQHRDLDALDIAGLAPDKVILMNGLAMMLRIGNIVSSSRNGRGNYTLITGI